MRGEGSWPKKMTGAPDGCVTPLPMANTARRLLRGRSARWRGTSTWRWWTSAGLLTPSWWSPVAVCGTRTSTRSRRARTSSTESSPSPPSTPSTASDRSLAPPPAYAPPPSRSPAPAVPKTTIHGRSRRSGRSCHGLITFSATNFFTILCLLRS